MCNPGPRRGPQTIQDTKRTGQNLLLPGTSPGMFSNYFFIHSLNRGFRLDKLTLCSGAPCQPLLLPPQLQSHRFLDFLRSGSLLPSGPSQHSLGHSALLPGLGNSFSCLEIHPHPLPDPLTTFVPSALCKHASPLHHRIPSRVSGTQQALNNC